MVEGLLNMENRIKHKGYYVVSVTHPDMPNDSSLSRGRKRHLTLDGEKSLCKMMVVDYFRAYFTPTEGWFDPWVNNGLCKVCKLRVRKNI